MEVVSCDVRELFAMAKHFADDERSVFLERAKHWVQSQKNLKQEMNDDILQEIWDNSRNIDWFFKPLDVIPITINVVDEESGVYQLLDRQQREIAILKPRDYGYRVGKLFGCKTLSDIVTEFGTNNDRLIKYLEQYSK